MREEDKNKDKIIFASVLRGLAAFIVAFNHICIVYFNDSKVIQKFIRNDYFDFNGANNNILHKLGIRFFEVSGISLGTFGVAVFFLISGFVIPFSLEKRNFFSFMLNRIVRIVPTLFVAISLATLALAVQQYLNPNGGSYYFNLKEFLANVSLLRPFTSQNFIDPVVWTLEVEMYFYLFIGVCSSFFSLKSSRTILGAGLSLIFIAFLFDKLDFSGARFLERNTYFINFMLLGVCFYNLYSQNWSKKIFIRTILGLLIIAIVNNQIFISPRVRETSNMIAAFLSFTALYFLNSKIKSYKVLTFISDISYSLYISHQIVGYILLSYFISNFSIVPEMASIITLAVMILYGFVIYIFIEKPTMALAKRI